MMKFNLSLNQRLIGITVVAFVIIIGLITVNEYQSIKNETILSKKESVIIVSDNIKYRIISMMLQSKNHAVKYLLKKTDVMGNAKQLRVFNPRDNVIMVSSNDSDIGGKLPEKDYNWYLKYNDGTPYIIEENNTQYIIRFLPIENMKACHKCHSPNQGILGIIEIKFSLDRTFLAIKGMIVNHLIFSLLSIILFSLVFSYIVIKLIDEPLDGIMEAIKYVEEGNLEKQIHVRRADIVGKLSEKFNNMTSKINDAHKEVEKYHRGQMKRASQMAMIGEIASGIAHEIKNPLACISAALQVIDGDLDEKNEHKPVIKEVVNQVTRLDNTVKRILEFAKPVKSQKALVAVDEILKETLFFISQFANKKSIEVNIVSGEGIKRVYADGKSLRQVFLNICLNGIEAMKEHGVINIVTAMVDKESFEGKKEYVEVSIQDRGSGISEENLVGIFDPFFTTKESGTGLGLSISAQIVEEHGGFIDVESALGQGATFKIHIPAVNKG